MKWSRRNVIGAAGAGLATAAIRPARAATGKITVADPGGPYSPAYRKAFYEPFEKATGIQVVGVTHDSTPVAQVKAMVEAKAPLWDVVSMSPFQTTLLTALGDYLEPIGATREAFPGMLPVGMTPVSAGIDVFGTVMAYRTDSYPKGGPTTWADFWDVAKFPGRRALRRSPQILDVALLADGVPPDQLYPLDVDRGFRSLDRIKPHVSVWWSNGAQSTQLLESGEVDMTYTWNGRAQAAIDGGAPVKIAWNQGLYELDVWAIPKGCPRLELAQQFVRFACQPGPQAIVSNYIAYGPANLDAFKTIPQDRVSLLPTYPPNLAGMRPMDDAWWAANYDKLFDRFNSWILG